MKTLRGANLLLVEIKKSVLRSGKTLSTACYQSIDRHSIGITIMKLFQRIIQLGYLVVLSCAAQAQQTCNVGIPESTPTVDFVANGNGTVTHSKTGLMWKRCVEGQTWSGSVCTGSASTVSWSEALKAALGVSTAGFSDWRVPNVKELESIVEGKCSWPSINSSIFPSDNVASYFWSASPSVVRSDHAWLVHFGYGGADYGTKGDDYQVRLVRSGRSFASFDALDTLALAVTKTGTGTVSGGPISCGVTCNGKAGRGFTVTLTATPAVNLLTWGGACSGNAATCTVTMDSAKSVTASFKDTALVVGLPSALSFATQNIGSTSAAQSVALSNAGTTAMAIDGIAITGDFGVTHNCGTGLGPGGFCNLRLTFSPAASGTRSGSVTLTSNAPGSPHSIALSGLGQGGTSLISATALSFASQAVGVASTAQTVTLSNTGVAALNIGSIAVTGDFTHATTCGATLATGANCSISVRFLPTVTGALRGILIISSDDVNSPTTVTLIGTGVASPVVSLSKTALRFGLASDGSSSMVQTVTLANRGTLPLLLDSIAVSGDFSVDHNCGAGLGAGGSCTLTISVVPTGAVNGTGAIAIISNAPQSPHTLGLIVSSSSPSDDADKVFAWAEQTYPDFFSPANVASQSNTGYRFRAYQGGGFLAVNESDTPNLYYLGPLSGYSVLDLGLLATWLLQVFPFR